MRIIRNKYMPFAGFRAINLFGILFARPDARISDIDLNHEAIHTAQIKEMLYVPFYLWYFIEWIIRLFNEGNAYRNISFENEAYQNEDNILYLDDRESFAWMKY